MRTNLAHLSKLARVVLAIRPTALPTISVQSISKVIPMVMQRLPRLAMILWLLSSPLALANSNSMDRPPHTGGRSAGSRGCPTTQIVSAPEDVPALILLAPPNSIAQTVSTYPTFGWFVRDSGTWPMAFRVYHYASDRGEYDLITEVTGETFQSNQGLNVLELPDSAPALSAADIYLWQVELICDPSQPSGNLFAEAEIQLVELPPVLSQQLGTASDDFQQASLYHEAGFWHDALGITLTAPAVPALSELRARLLEPIGANPDEASILRESPIQVFQ